MKKNHIVPIALIVVILGGTLALRLWPRTLTVEQCSEVYQKYVGRNDIQASFIKNKRINGSMAVDMTMLAAVGDSGWTVLQHDFRIPVIPKEYEEYFYADTNQLSLKLVSKKNPSLPMDSIVSNNDLVAISYPKRLICIFSIEDTTQLKALLRDSYDNNVILKQ